MVFLFSQQEQVLGELYWYTHQNPPPTDASTTSETLAYLEACNLLFERGFLCHEQIRSLDSIVLKNISKGYSYFSSWLTSILDKGMELLYCRKVWWESIDKFGKLHQFTNISLTILAIQIILQPSYGQFAKVFLSI